MSLTLISIISAVFICFLCLLLFLNIFGLPANWLILFCAFAWSFFYKESATDSALYWIILCALALTGEILETVLQMFKAKKHGSSKGGAVGGMIGAIIGGIAFAPFFLGLGALVGALFGAWGGCFIVEFMKGRNLGEARHAAYGTMTGRFLGTICKCLAGALMVAIIAHNIWPSDRLTSFMPNYQFFALSLPFRVL